MTTGKFAGEFQKVPVIDISSLVEDSSTRERKEECGRLIHEACVNVGFFYVSNHGVSEALMARLERISREFFKQDVAEKMKFHMANGGRAWRGYFRVGDELTSGKPDIKEGIYFGQELADDHPMVLAGIPMFGRNLFPSTDMKEAVLEYQAALERLGFQILQGIAVGLGLPFDFFSSTIFKDPVELFRIFNYPPDPKLQQIPDYFSVGVHTDYGGITILRQDSSGGLMVQNRNNEWIPAPPVSGTFVINIGDMMETLTSGLYRSTPHCVKNPQPFDRLSYPFFFDPDFNARLSAIPLSPEHLEKAAECRRQSEAAGFRRWDGKSVVSVTGTYGDYLLHKVGKVFPELAVRQIQNGSQQ
eukprot:ANDGO_03939.mRNA.1 putative iron/ascorbate oxidoreductase DDB_G0283291